MIKKGGGDYYVYDSSGKKRLNKKPKTKKEAIQQVAAIEISKKKRGKGKPSNAEIMEIYAPCA